MPALIPAGDDEDPFAGGSNRLHVLPGPEQALQALLRDATRPRNRRSFRSCSAVPAHAGRGKTVCVGRSTPFGTTQIGLVRPYALIARASLFGEACRQAATARDARSRTTSRPTASSRPHGGRPRGRACRAGISDRAGTRVGSSAGSRATDTSRGRSRGAARGAAPAAPGQAWRVAKRRAADHLVQATGWPLPSANRLRSEASASPNICNLYSNVGKCPA